MTSDPTIPELVARLRELHEKLQALQVGTPEFTAARQLFRDVLQLSAPGILDALDHIGDANKMASSPWRPIEECGELEAGEYPVRMKRGALEPLITIARWSGAEWQVRIVDAERYYYRAEHITHVHEMGPIRGPGEG